MPRTFEDDPSGWLYCLYNDCFKSYGDDVYKLGRTNNIKRRLQSYSTSYIQPSKFIVVSEKKFTNSIQAESILFFILRKDRIKDKREFFNCHIDKIKHIISKLSYLSDQTIQQIYNKILARICPLNILDQILDNNNTDEQHNWFEKSIEYKDRYDDFFEKYRFIPSDPSFYKYYTYKYKEDYDLSNLIKDINFF